MKKLFLVLMVVFSCVLLVSCKDDTKKATFKFELEDGIATRNSYTYDYKLEDPDSQLKYSEITYEVKKDGGQTVLKSGTIDTAKTSFTISALEGNTKYSLNVKTVFENEDYALITNRIFQTLSEGGSDETPYEIGDADTFVDVLKSDYVGHYKLTADIDLEGYTIMPMYTSSTSYFSGTFDGDGHTIKNFKLGSLEEPYLIADSVSYAGLFGAINESGIIRNVTFENAELYLKRNISSTTYYSFIAGYNAGTIKNVTIKDSKLVATGSTSTIYTGAICGKLLEKGTVEDCKVINTTIIANTNYQQYVGGLVALNESSKGLYRSSFAGTIEASSKTETRLASVVATTHDLKVGGIVGQNNSVVLSCDADANIKVTSDMPNAEFDNYTLRTFVGGVVGYNYSDSSVVSQANAKVTFDLDLKDAKELYVGSLVGLNGNIDKEKGYAIVLSSKAQAKEQSTIAYSGKLNLGLVGLDKSEKSAYEAEDEVLFTLNSYASKKTETAKLVQKVKLTTEGYEVVETLKDNCSVTLKYAESAVAITLVTENIDLSDLAKNTEVEFKLAFTSGHALNKIYVNGEETDLKLDENSQFKLTIEGDTTITISVSHAH